MTYCKDCRTEFMVEADDPCPRCGRYLGGERMGQRAEVALPEQSAQPAAQKTLMDAVREHFGFAQPEPPVAQQAPVPPPAAPAPEDEPPRPAQQGQTLWDAIAQGVFSLFVRLMLLALLAKMLVDIKLLPSAWAWPMVVGLAITMAVITILSKTSQRAAQERARRLAQTAQPAAQQAPVPPSAAPAPEDASPRPAQQVQTPLDAAMQGCASLVLRWIPLIMVANVLLNELPEKNLLPPVWWAWAAALAIVIPVIFTFRKTFQAGGAGKGAAAGAIGADGGASVIARLVLLVLLAVPALIGFAGLVFEERNPYVGVLWLLYLSVFAPLVCCVFMPFDELDDLMRGHHWFCVIWLLWVFLATGLFLWGMSDPNTFRIFLSVFGGGYY